MNARIKKEQREGTEDGRDGGADESDRHRQKRRQKSLPGTNAEIVELSDDD